MKQLFLAITAFCLMASGCNETKKVIADAVEINLVGMYTVISINGGYISPAASLQFNKKDNAISGYSGCNDFGGTYKQAATTIKIGQLMMTKAYCEEVMQNEYALLNALKNVTLFDISEGVLTLYSERNGKVLLTAVKNK
jgi:heat shock protein HslJ